MNRINQLNTPTKIIILIIFFILTSFAGIMTYLTIADEVAARKISSYFTGETENEITTEEKIPFESKTVDDDSLEEGQTEVRQKGEEGIKRIIVRITKDKDGNIINREVTKVEISKEPVDEITAIGVKKEADPQSAQANNSRQSGNSSSGGNKNSNRPSTGGATNNNSGANNNTPNSSSSENWLAYNQNAIIDLCEKGVAAKYGVGFYIRPKYVSMGDTGWYKTFGWVKQGNGYLNIGCSFKSKFVGEQVYYDANSRSVWDAWPGHIYSEDDIKEYR